MKGLRVTFKGDSASIDFNSMVDGFWPTVQNTTVGVGQKIGEDKIFPKKGTALVAGQMSRNNIEHLYTKMTLISYELMEFTNSTDSEFNEDKLAKYSLDISGVSDSGILQLSVQATSSKGEKVITTI